MPSGDLECIWKSGRVPGEPKMGNPEVQSFHSLTFLMVSGRKLRCKHYSYGCKAFPDLLMRELVAAIT